jgi:hypothetical protein
METKAMQVIQNCPVRTAAGLHGAVIPGAMIYVGNVLVIEQSSESPHDGWVHVVGPNPPINANGNKPAWVELSHLKDANAQSDTIVINIDWTNKTWAAKAG